MRRLLTTLVLIALAAGCQGTLGLAPGTFLVQFTWAGDAPRFDTPVYVFARVEDASTGKKFQTVGPTEYPTNRRLPAFSDIPNGDHRIVKVEMRLTSDPSSQVLYYGQSSPFSLQAGDKDKLVKVVLGLTPTPGQGGLGGSIGLAVRPTGRDGYVKTNQVELVLFPGSGTRVKLANRPQDLTAAAAQSLASLAAAPEGNGAVVFPNWDLNGADEGGCDVTTEPTGCPRRVYAQFVDSNDYVSQTVSAGVILDQVAPRIAAADVQPRVVRQGATVTVTVAANEPLRNEPSHLVTPLDGQPGIELVPPTGTVLTHAVTDTLHDGRFGVVFSMEDYAGNTATVPDEPVTFRLDTVAPAVLGLKTQLPARFSEVSGFNHVAVEFDLAKTLACPSAQCVVQVDGHNLDGCVTSTSDSGTPHYTCGFDVPQPPTATDGSKPVSVSTLDDAGNTGFDSRSVVFDFQPPRLGALLRPNPARAGDQVTLLVTSDKPVARPDITVAPAGSLALPTTTGADLSTSWTFQFPAVDARLHDTFAVTVAAADDVGHSASWTGSLLADGVVPEIVFRSGENRTYSEMPGFNVVSTTFDVPKNLDGVSDGLIVSVGTHRMTCDPYSATSPNYTCRWTIPAQPAPSDAGPQSILVQTRDAAGNTRSSSINVTFDFAPLTLTGAVNPTPARHGDTPVLSLTSGKPLAEAPALTINETTSTLPLTGSGTAWSYSLGAAESLDAGTYTLKVTAHDAVGHTASLTLPPVQIDGVVPLVSNIAVTPPAGLSGARFSAHAGFNQIAVSFDTYKGLARTRMASTSVTLNASCGGILCAPFVCEAAATTSPTYTCRYTLTGNEGLLDGRSIAEQPEAIVSVEVAVTDAVGNTAHGSTTATLDFKAPALLEPPAVTYTPKSPNVLALLPTVTASAATIGTQVNVAFAFDEALAGPPSVSLADDALSFAPATQSGSTRVFRATIPTLGAPSDGTHALRFQGTDLVGNGADRFLLATAPGVVVDAAPPEQPNTAPGGPITYNRAPWGSVASGGRASFSLVGAAQAARPGDVVVAYSPTASLLGSGTVDPTGAFALALTPADLPVVQLAAVDGAGNESALADARNVSWTTNLSGKEAGSLESNPNRVDVSSRFLVTPSRRDASLVFGDFTQDARFTSEASDVSGLVGEDDGRLFSTTATPSAWLPLPIGGSGPTAGHYEAVFDSTRGRLVVFTDITGETWEWDGRSWTQRTPVHKPSGRRFCTLAYDSARARVVLFGGVDSSTTHGDTWEWDGTDWKDVSPAEGPSPRSVHAMAYDPIGQRTLLFGGVQSDQTTPVDDVMWSWDGAQWTPMTPATLPPAGQRILLYDDVGRRMLLLGGPEAQQDLWTFDGEDWAPVLQTGTVAPNNGIFSHATFDSENNQIVYFSWDSTWTWDGVTWTDRSALPGPPATSDFPRLAFDLIRRRTVLTLNDNSGQSLRVWEWDGASWRDVSAVQSAPVGRYYFPISTDPDRHRLIVMGGVDRNGTAWTDTSEWNGNAWTTVASAPTVRLQTAMAYHPATQQTVLFGGNGDAGPLADTWVWKDATWTEVAPATHPRARQQHAMVYDAFDDQLLLFGGYGYITSTRQDYLNDTWQWVGNDWQRLTPTAAPVKRANPCLAYDSARHRTVLFGGENQSTRFGDTWEWDGATWTDVTPASGPPARTRAAMTYDPVRGRVVLHGGVDATTHPLSDVWEWDGTSWVDVSPSQALPARYGHAMAYDTVNQQIVLLGGRNDGVGELADQWIAPSDSYRAAAFASISFAAVRDATAVLQQARFHAVARGSGSTVVVPGVGDTIDGVTLAAWDTSALAWRILDATDSGAPALAALDALTGSPAEAARYLWNPSGARQIKLVLYSTQGRGNGTTPALALDSLEATLQYQRPLSSGTDLLTNGGFEEGLSGWTAPAELAQLQSDDAFEGTSSVLLSGPGELQQILTGPFAAGQIVTLQGQVRTLAGEGVHIAVDGDGWSDRYATLAAHGATWAPFLLRFSVPAETTSLVVRIRSTEADRTALDAIRLGVE